VLAGSVVGHHTLWKPAKLFCPEIGAVFWVFRRPRSPQRRCHRCLVSHRDRRRSASDSHDADCWYIDGVRSGRRRMDRKHGAPEV